MEKNNEMQEQLEILNKNISKSYYGLVDAFSRLSLRVRKLEQTAEKLEKENKELKIKNMQRINFSLN